jgi:hypothetical protein
MVIINHLGRTLNGSSYFPDKPIALVAHLLAVETVTRHGKYRNCGWFYSEMQVRSHSENCPAKMYVKPMIT